MTSILNEILETILPQCLYMIGFLGNFLALIAIYVRKPLSTYPARNIYFCLISTDTLKLALLNVEIYFKNLRIISNVICKSVAYVKFFFHFILFYFNLF